MARPDMSPSPETLSTTEYVVLGILADAPAHGFAVARELAADGEVGRVFTVRRSLIYRALDRLVAAGCARAVATEQGDAGPRRVIHEVTRTGHRRLQTWLTTPVDHIRDLRIEFLVKLTLIRRAGESPVPLIIAQRAALGPTLDALDESPNREIDSVELWRRHNAVAAASYLSELEEIYRGNTG